MGILLCEQNFRDVWRRNKSVRAEIGQMLRTHTHTHTHAAKLVVEIIMAGMAVFFNVAGYLIEDRRRWPYLPLHHEDNVLN